MDNVTVCHIEFGRDVFTRNLAKKKHWKSHYCALINHGERGDYAEGFQYNQDIVDPPITPNGLKQSLKTGQFLKEHFERKCTTFDKIIIECSPYLRSMMTAGQIAKALDIKEVVVNYKASDLASASAETNPLSKLEFTKYKGNFTDMKLKDKIYQSEQYFPSDVNFVEKK